MVDNIQPALLLLIYKKPSHGYELIQNFNALEPSEQVESGTIYRNLRRMEKDGFIASKWEPSKSGPARRQYRITCEGVKALDAAVIRLEQQKKYIEEFLTAYNHLKEGGGKGED